MNYGNVSVQKAFRNTLSHSYAANSSWSAPRADN